MKKFIEMMNTRNDEERCRLMIYINLFLTYKIGTLKMFITLFVNSVMFSYFFIFF